MKDYWLAKLISSVDEVDSRKRLQKSIYLLQRADCPLQCDYLLHYYGPYSFELAGLIDQLHAAEIIKEAPEPLGTSVIRYRSKITEKGKQVLNRFEKSPEGQQFEGAIAPFIPQFKKLNQQDAWVLELAATVAYYFDGSWKDAQTQTARFKRIRIRDNKLLLAVRLAKGFAGTQ
ncbi:MAG: hypothetical protein ACYS76_03445 [Planctomycetota bacterium]